MSVYKILFAIFFIAITQMSFAQKNEDTDKPILAIKQQSIFLDSLLNTWYFTRDKSEINYSGNSTPIFMQEETSDSTYIKRLEKLPVLFPVSYNRHVKGWIELYLRKNRRTPYLIGLTDYYFPIFEEILDSYELPLELKYLPIIESALNPQARSRAGAVGLWQFMYGTGKMYGLEINSYVDERKDPLKSTHAAAHFLKDMYDVYGDWALVIAAYNCGPGNVNKAIRRSGGKTEFWEIYQYLPRETRGYIPAFISAMYVMNYYQDHNIKPIKIDMNIFTDTVMVNEKLHLMQVAEKLDIPYEELAILNPQYRKQIIPGNYKPYPLRLPINKVGNFITYQKEIYKYKDSIFFSGRPIVIIPKGRKSRRGRYGKGKKYSYKPRNFTPPSTKGKRKIIYTVKSGDNYGFISEWYNVRISELKYWNNTYSNRLKLGQKLVVWVPARKYSYYKGVNNMSFEKKQALNKVYAKSKSKGVKRTVNSSPNDNRFVWYQIKKGESLWTIAQKFDDVTDKDIRRINRFTRRDLTTLKTGQYIKIKMKR